MPQEYQLVVAPNAKCISVVRFILDNIDVLKGLDMRFHVVKAPTDTAKLKALTDRGITNTPTMIAPGGNLLVGVTDIMKMLKRNVSRAESTRQRSVQQGEYDAGFTRTGDELNDYMMANVFAGVPRGRPGKPAIPSNDDDDETMNEDAGVRYDRRMRQMESRRKSARPQNDEEADIQHSRPRRSAPMDDEEVTNIGGFDDAPSMSRRGTGAPKQPARGQGFSGLSQNQMDDKMLKCLIDGCDGVGENVVTRDI